MATTTKSEVPLNCRGGVPVKAGIDEAGRGPVLGAMVYGIAYWPISEDESLSKMNFDDSKALTEKQRETLFSNLKGCGKIGWATMSISPEGISAQMLRRVPYNLNAISHDAAMTLVRMLLDDGVNVQEVYVDTVGDAERYQEKLSRAFEDRIAFTVSKKADSLFSVVSAASICAKVTRDAELSTWQFREPGFIPKGTLGSGYPGDEKTKEWLHANMDKVFGFPSLVRFSWSTCKDLLDKEAVPVKWEEEEDEPMVGQPKLSFPSASKGSARCDFMRRLGVSHVVDDF